MKKKILTISEVKKQQLTEIYVLLKRWGADVNCDRIQTFLEKQKVSSLIELPMKELSKVLITLNTIKDKSELYGGASETASPEPKGPEDLSGYITQIDVIISMILAKRPYMDDETLINTTERLTDILEMVG